MSIEQLPHVCECEECRAEHDMRIAAALAYADRYYTWRQQLTKVAQDKFRLYNNVIQFPVDRTKAMGEL